jgi:hypothetical protein
MNSSGPESDSHTVSVTFSAFFAPLDDELLLHPTNASKVAEITADAAMIPFFILSS